MTSILSALGREQREKEELVLHMFRMKAVCGLELVGAMSFTAPAPLTGLLLRNLNEVTTIQKPNSLFGVYLYVYVCIYQDISLLWYFKLRSFMATQQFTIQALMD